MKKALMFLSVIFFLGGCDSKEEENLCFNYDTSMSFSVLNAKNEDLLDPENLNSINVSKIKLFYEIDGEIKEQVLGADFIKGFYKNMITNKYQITIPLNSSDLRKKSVTYIQWEENDTDTLQSTFDTGHCYTRVDQVWLNGKLILDSSSSKNVYTITK